MLRLTILLLTALAPLATVHGQTKRDRSLDSVTSLALETVMKRHPFEAFRAFGKGQQDRTRAQWFGREASAAIETKLATAALAGLWDSDTEVVRGALRFVDERSMDLLDMARYHEFAAPIVFEEGLGSSRLIDFDVFKHTASSAQLDRFLRRRPQWSSSFRSFLIQDLHRSLRPSHLPALAQVARCDDPVLRRQAFRLLGTVALYTDQRRELIAKTVLEWPGPIPRAQLLVEDPKLVEPYRPRGYALARKPLGYPALLAATLRRIHLGAGEVLRKMHGFGDWSLRWAAASRPDASDRALLLELLARPEETAQNIALLGLRQLHDTTSGQAIVAALPGMQGTWSRALAHATLVIRAADVKRRGAAEAAAENALLAGALEDDVFLAAALEVMPERAVAQWASSAFGEDPEVGGKAIHRLSAALRSPDFGPLRISDATLDSIYQAVQRQLTGLDRGRLSQLVEDLPLCRSAALGQALLQALRPGPIPGELLRYLLLVDETGLRRTLASWLKLPGSRDHAADLLLEIGSAEHGALLVQRMRADSAASLLTLARSGESPAVRQYLATSLAGSAAAPIPDAWAESLAANGQALGLPGRLCASWASELESIPRSTLQRDFARWRTDMLAGKAIEVLVATLRAVPLRQLGCRNLHLCKDPRVLALLAEVRDLPGAQYQVAVSELAAAGDAASLREFEQSLQRACYGWHADLPANLLTLGLDPRWVPYWLGEVETNCCRRIAAGQALEALCGLDVTETGGQCLVTARAWSARWWRRNGRFLRHSELAGRLILGPR